MGQYYKIVNLTKKEFITPYAFGDGAKLMEFGASGGGAMAGLAVLLASGNGRGGGDLSSDNPIVGSWAGDRIVIAGDYDDGGLYLTKRQIARTLAKYNKQNPKYQREAEDINLYTACSYSGLFKDISADVIAALCDEDYSAEELVSRTRYHSMDELVPALQAARRKFPKALKRA